jgi:hypothetical protein
MASNITYPEKHAVWFIEGNNLCLLTNLNSTGSINTTDTIQAEERFGKLYKSQLQTDYYYTIGQNQIR